MTLNQIAERICLIINQPSNHILKERIKDVAKGLFANRLMLIIQQQGISEFFKLSFTAELEEKNIHTLIPSYLTNSDRVVATINKIPIPVNFRNDAPFTSVTTLDGRSIKYINSNLHNRYTHLLFPIGDLLEYKIINNYLILSHVQRNEIISDDNVITDIIIESIWENPEEVLNMYLYEDDGQNLELPFPISITENIIQEILKTEFGIMPKDEDVKINKDINIK